jgi:hypothetical protein
MNNSNKNAGTLKNGFIKFEISMLTLIFCITLFSISIFNPLFSAQFTIEKSLEKNVAPWVKIECLKITDTQLKTEPFHPKAVQSHPIVQNAFGTETPEPTQVLIHYAPAWNTSKKTPVLLVHGAGDNAYRAWAHPWEFVVAPGNPIKVPGMMQFLSNKGYPVFALTFSHSHGNNFYQALQLSAAIDRIKKITNKSKINVITHSKGAMPARIYMSDMKKIYKTLTWLPEYGQDVDKVIFIAGPLKGVDTPFRYYAYNLAVYTQSLGAPFGADRLNIMGMYVDVSKYKNMFQGQYQMLYNWVKDGIPLSIDSATPDFQISANALYNGGYSVLLTSKGIDDAIKKSGSLIYTLNKQGLDPTIKISVLAGSRQVVDYINMGFMKIPVGEKAAPSDGVAFVASTTYTDGLTARGAVVHNKHIIEQNHVMVTVHKDALEFVEKVLK